MLDWIKKQNRIACQFPNVPLRKDGEHYFKIGNDIHGPFLTEEFPSEYRNLLIEFPLKTRPLK